MTRSIFQASVVFKYLLSHVKSPLAPLYERGGINRSLYERGELMHPFTKGGT
jgi:hypothetical protein